MAAKKKPTSRAKASGKMEPARPLDAPPGRSPEATTSRAESEPERAGPPVAGIGASAGGLDAFKKFFTAMPTDSGIAFVLIPHLDPKHESLMVELIGRYTDMPVVEATDGTTTIANHVYIIPPNKYMTITDGVLRLTGPVERGGPQTSIDLFLRSLANDRQEKAICIILSGTGSHGSLGLKAIKGSHGMAMVQDPATAEFPRMPESAIATGLADYVLPAEKMPEALIKYVEHDNLGAAAGLREAPDHLNEVLALLRARTRFDFRGYRQKMLLRRLQRRMSLRHFDQIADYLAFVRDHPDEVKQLSRDLLISVTHFFRDPEAFQALETEVIEPLVNAHAADVPLRIWCAGCATGEEPYSLGILILEQMAAAKKSRQVQIFATDVDQDALDVARKATYPESISTDVAPERLARFFMRVDDACYRVSKPLREIMIFARQNLITDAPFSRLDLIVCRNLLIYLEPEVQKKVISLMHFALNDGGFLFLGPTETIGGHTDLFEPISKKWRIFRRIGPSRSDRVEIPIATAISPFVQQQGFTLSGSARSPGFAELTQRLLLDEFAPAAVLVNRAHEILYLFGPTDHYLAVSAGAPTHSLLTMVRQGLRTKLRSAVQKALRENITVTVADAAVERNDDFHPVIVTVRPVPGPRGADRLCLVTFQDSDQELLPKRPPETAAEESAVRQLESELKATREELQNTIEELENSNEELKVSNGEVMSMNEELQSANEELETSKEELQSLNEELTTVNNQLQDKLADLEAANNDMANLLHCSDVAIIFLDEQIRIKRYTPPATHLFNLIATDIGRPISDINPRFSDGSLQGDVEHVLQSAMPRERQFETVDGRWWNLRITAYRTLESRIEGVVLTFTDVTRARQADEQTRRLATVLLDSNDAVIVQDLDERITAWNRGAERMLGYTEAEALKMSAEQVIPARQLGTARAVWDRLRRGERVDSWESERVTKDGRMLNVWVTATALKDETGRPVAIAKTERDITEQKRAHTLLEREIEQRTAALRDSQQQLAAILHTAADAIITINGTGIIQSVNAATERMFAYAAAEMIGKNVSMLMPGSYRREHDQYLANYDKTRIRKMIGTGREVAGQRKDGSLFPVELTVSEVDHLKIYTGILRDITERKKAEQAVLESERFAHSTLDALTAQIAIVDQNGKILAVNQAWRNFAAANGPIRGNVSEGANYLSACEANAGRFSDEGPVVARGIRAVLAGELPEFAIEYPCHAPDQDRWFVVRVTPFPGTGPRRVVIAHENITRRKQLERDVVEVASQEQRRIGQDLHDTVGQELTALNMLAGDLAEILRTGPANGSKLVKQMVQGLQRSQHELRTVMRGLLPVPVDAEGLMAALSDLAERTWQEWKVNCRFECPRPVSVANNLTATHLFLIAQEAVHNAVKHARPTNVRIILASNHLMSLRVYDDGIGMPDHTAEDHGGLGLRIMQNRAAIVGATLTIEPAEPTGTVVSCTLPRKGHET